MEIDEIVMFYSVKILLSNYGSIENELTKRDLQGLYINHLIYKPILRRQISPELIN